MTKDLEVVVIHEDKQKDILGIDKYDRNKRNVTNN